jgi:predicted nucleic acid-binding protein
VIVVDSSAWTEFLRGTGSLTHLTLRRMFDERDEIAVTEVVVTEVLAGARSPRHLTELRSLMLGFPVLSLKGLDGYEAAAELYRLCRVKGETVKKMTDCLIAVAAIDAGAPVLHNDADFDALSRHTPLEVVTQAA